MTPNNDLPENATREEIAAYLKSRTPLFVDSEEYEEMSLSYVNPDLVEEDAKK